MPLRKPTARITGAGALFCAASSITPMPALSQSGAVLEEVIVTARRREESLQETPVAVTALDAESLREAGVRNIYDLNQLAPNIDVSNGNGSSGAANIYIRGVGQRNTGANIDSGVGIYLDEVYLGRPDGALLDIADIQSVQVLRGPQGTLFGKNTTGGALVLTTNRPGEEFEGNVQVRVGNYDRLDANAVLNLPITDTLYTRFSLGTVERDGYLENTFDGIDYTNEDRQFVTWQTRWVPTDDLTFDLNLNWSDTNQTARPQKCVLVPGFEGWQAELFNVLAVAPSTGRTVDDYCEDAQNAGDEYTITSDLGGDYRAETGGAALTVNWDINDSLAFKSITAWRGTKAGEDNELDHSAIPFLHRTQFEHPLSDTRNTDQYSQEFQFIGSALDDRLQYVAGLFWFREKTVGGETVNILGPFDPAISNLFFFNTSAAAIETDNDAWAAFTQLEFEISESWRASLGLRYTDESRELVRTRYVADSPTLDANGGFVLDVGGGLYAVDRSVFEFNPDYEFQQLDVTRGETSDDAVTPMASIQYMFDDVGAIDAGSIYLTYSEGFLSGGLSEAPSGDLEEFLPEQVQNWELGFKLDLLDRRLRLNGAFFNSDYDDRQLTTLVINPETSSPAPATINAKSSTIRGFELESSWLATPNLLLSFNVTLTDGEIKEFDDVQLTIADSPEPDPGCVRSDLTVLQVDSCPNDRSDENLPRLAEKTFLLAAQYTWETSVGTFLPRLQAGLKQDIDYCFDSASCRSGLWLEDEQFDLSGRVTWLSNDGKWIGALYGSNLTDERYLVGGIALVESQGVGGYSYMLPRMYGLELQYSF